MYLLFLFPAVVLLLIMDTFGHCQIEWFFAYLVGWFFFS